MSVSVQNTYFNDKPSFQHPGLKPLSSVEETHRRLLFDEEKKMSDLDLLGSEKQYHATIGSGNRRVQPATTFDVLNCIRKLGNDLKAPSTVYQEMARLAFFRVRALNALARHLHPSFPKLADWAMMARLKGGCFSPLTCLKANPRAQSTGEPEFAAKCFAAGNYMIGTDEKLYISASAQGNVNVPAVRWQKVKESEYTHDKGIGVAKALKAKLDRMRKRVDGHDSDLWSSFGMMGEGMDRRRNENRRVYNAVLNKDPLATYIPGLEGGGGLTGGDTSTFERSQDPYFKPGFLPRDPLTTTDKDIRQPPLLPPPFVPDVLDAPPVPPTLTLEGQTLVRDLPPVPAPSAPALVDLSFLSKAALAADAEGALEGQPRCAEAADVGTFKRDDEGNLIDDAGNFKITLDEQTKKTVRYFQESGRIRPGGIQIFMNKGLDLFLQLGDEIFVIANLSQITSGTSSTADQAGADLMKTFGNFAIACRGAVQDSALAAVATMKQAKGYALQLWKNIGIGGTTLPSLNPLQPAQVDILQDLDATSAELVRMKAGEQVFY